MPRPKKGFGCWLPALFILATLEAGFYTFCHIHLLKMGYSVRQLEARMAAASDENRILKFKFSALKTPENIVQELEKRNLGLSECTNRRIVCLREPAAAPCIDRLPKDMRPRNGFWNLVLPDTFGSAAAKK